MGGSLNRQFNYIPCKKEMEKIIHESSRLILAKRKFLFFLLADKNVFHALTNLLACSILQI